MSDRYKSRGRKERTPDFLVLGRGEGFFEPKNPSHQLPELYRRGLQSRESIFNVLKPALGLSLKRDIEFGRTTLRGAK